MVPGLQIAGLFLTITVVLAFTAWAEAWLASKSAPTIKRQPNTDLSDGVEVAAFLNQGDTIRAA